LRICNAAILDYRPAFLFGWILNFLSFPCLYIKTLSFVKKATPLSKKENAVIKDLEMSAKEVRLHKQGKIKLKTARELLYEL